MVFTQINELGIEKTVKCVWLVTVVECYLEKVDQIRPTSWISKEQGGDVTLTGKLDEQVRK